MKHKTFSKENEKKLKLIIKAQEDEIRRLETEIRELKKETLNTGRSRKPKVPKKDPPTKQVTRPTKEVIKPKVQKPMSEAERKAFCDDFSKRWKKSREDDSTESDD